MIKDIKELLDQISKIGPLTLPRELESFERTFQALIKQNPGDRVLLLNYNEFRVSNASKLLKTRPQILVGGPLGVLYPNLHTYPLFEVADVVCLTFISEQSPLHSALFCTPTTLFFDVLKRLPAGFEPDFYWDNQIENEHFIPAGIEIAPFPIVASLCHTYLHKSVEHVCELFDRVLPISKSHSEILKKKYPDKIIDLPFGVNWGAFDDFITPSWEKSIDVLIPFSESDKVPYCSKRNRVLELVRKFKDKYGTRFSIKTISGLPHEEYLSLLKQSRIAINVTGINGPYNYRTMESMCCGSMVFQYDWGDEFFKNNFSELFVEGVHGVSFNFENFESKLLHYLEHRELTEKIARSAYTYLKENYNYKVLYHKLINAIKKCEIKLPRKLPDQIDFHHIDMIYYYQNNSMVDLLSYGIVSDFDQRSWIHLNNLMIASGTSKDSSLFRSLLIVMATRQIAELENADIWMLCCKFYEDALSYTPNEFKWIIHWNYLLLSIEKGKAEKKDIAALIAYLKELIPQPFEEEQLTFKYYVDAPNYPEYALGESNHAFIDLNLELMKVIDKPFERAQLYRGYALKACEYLYVEFSKMLVKDLIADIPENQKK